MKLIADTVVLGNALTQVMNAVANRPSMAVLNNVLIEAQTGTVTLTTSNLDYGVRCEFSADVSEEGTLTLPVKKLTTIVKSLTHTSTEISSEDGIHAVVSAGGATFKLTGIDAQQFPALPEVSGESSVTLPCSDFLQMIHSVNYAQSSDEHRYILNGIYTAFEHQSLVLVATDGRRLATIRRELPQVSEELHGQSVIIPAKTIAEITRLLPVGENVTLSIAPKQMAFHIQTSSDESENLGLKQLYLVSKVVEGTYPNYQQVIPSSTESRIKIARDVFLGALQRASILTSEKNQSVKLSFSENLMEVSAQSSEYGESHERIAIVFENAPAIEITFNPRYLIEPLKAISDSEIIFEFRNHLSPGVIKNNDQFLCVIMPLRIGA